MGAAASVGNNSNLGAAAEATNLQMISNGGAAPMPDLALREALRQLQLSPDMIDKSATAIHAHARDPVEHPVDNDLSRLCTSEYTRGALHALSRYLAVVANYENGGESAKKAEVKVDGSTAISSPVALTGSAASAAAMATAGEHDQLAGTDGGGETSPQLEEAEGGSAMVNSMTGRLATILNRLRRTRSMPYRHHGTIIPTDDDAQTERPAGTGGGLGSLHEPAGVETSNKDPPPKLNVSVHTTPRSPRRPNLLAGLGLGSPRSSADMTTPRRAPVRTGHWKLGHEIGKGSFGAVHIGLNEDSGDLIAVKVLSLRNADIAEQLYREIELMRQLTHPNIVCYLGAEVNDSEKTISIFQEWVPGSVTTLLVNFGPFSDRRIAGYTKQILQGLLYLHRERVIHRDIKGGNILIDDRGVVKLCDFGASKMLDTKSFTDLSDHTRVGSPLFMAPEILLRQDYGPQVDIWSLGGAVLEMATGQPPWNTLNLRTPVALINWVKRTEGPPPLPSSLSQPLTRFLLRCFERDPNKRATAKELLSDPFVAKRHRQVLQSLGSDADSVSDIDNLSRTAAIERIRRASYSDCSGPNSSRSSVASDATTPRAPRVHQPGSKNGIMSTPERADSGSPARGGGGGGTLEAAARRAVEAVDSPQGGARVGRRSPPFSSEAALVSPLQVVTAGLEPSSGTRMATPPTRRLSAGRSGSASPNPFSGRRRSVENSPDASRSPRGSAASASLSKSRQENQPSGSNALATDSGSNTDGERVVAAGDGRDGGVVAAENENTVVMATVAVNADRVNVKRGSQLSPILMRSTKENRRKDGETSDAAEAASDHAPPIVPVESRSEHAERAPVLKPRKSGRGGRPSGGGAEEITGDGSAAAWQQDR